MKETTPEEVLKVMRHDNKKLNEQLDELKALRANLRKAGEAIAGAVIRYRKEKLKKKSLKAAEEQKPEMSDQTKLMRFLAGKFNEVDTTVQVTQAEILLRIGKIEDYLAQILRKMDG